MNEIDPTWRSARSEMMQNPEIDTPLSDQLEEVRPRTIQSYLNGALALGSDVGSNRNENQDRVIAALTYHPSLGSPTFIAAVADGMGGMADGGTCAKIALSSFLDDFMSGRPGSLSLRITMAVSAANKAVFERYRERGGSTLSAVAVQKNGPTVGVNVGDSRIYASTGSGFLPLTIDDTLSAAFGGEGNSLIQFVGMGDGMRSHMIEVPSNTHSLFISSDGAHFPDPETFAQLLARSPDPKTAVERGLALARWLGSPDNASLIGIDLSRLEDQFITSPKRFFGSFSLLGSVQVMANVAAARSQSKRSNDAETESPREVQPPKKRARSRKKKSEKATQLQIEITPDVTETNEDSE